MRIKHIALAIGVLLTFNTQAKVDGQAYLGKVPELNKEINEQQREPRVIFVKGTYGDIEKKLKNDFWEQYPYFASANSNSEPVGDRKNFFDAIVADEYEKGDDDVKAPVVHGLTSSHGDVSNIGYLYTEINFKSAKSKERVSYTKGNKKGWVRYEGTNIRFTEYIPENINSLALFSASEFKSHLEAMLSLTFDDVSKQTNQHINAFEKTYATPEDSGLLISDVCVTTGKKQKGLVGRTWRIKNSDELLKFIVFEVKKCKTK